nr:TPA_asm: m102.4 sORF 1 [Murid betaherpesvirus 1]DBA08050.1 TPA_asm: m102.4 sORF 1 [Murid betaherpesvirus 1]
MRSTRRATSLSTKGNSGPGRHIRRTANLRSTMEMRQTPPTPT